MTAGIHYESSNTRKKGQRNTQSHCKRDSPDGDRLQIWNRLANLKWVKNSSPLMRKGIVPHVTWQLHRQTSSKHDPDVPTANLRTCAELQIKPAGLRPAEKRPGNQRTPSPLRCPRRELQYRASAQLLLCLSHHNPTAWPQVWEGSVQYSKGRKVRDENARPVPTCTSQPNSGENESRVCHTTIPNSTALTSQGRSFTLLKPNPFPSNTVQYYSTIQKPD